MPAERHCADFCVSGPDVNAGGGGTHGSEKEVSELMDRLLEGLSPEEIALLMSMLDDNGDGEISCAARSHSLSCHKIFLVPPGARIS